VTVQANDGGLFTRLAFAWSLRRIQPLEYLEHFLLMFRRDANAIVLHRVVRLIVFHTAGHGMGKMPKTPFPPVDAPHRGSASRNDNKTPRRADLAQPFPERRCPRLARWFAR